MAQGYGQNMEEKTETHSCFGSFWGCSCREAENTDIMKTGVTSKSRWCTDVPWLILFVTFTVFILVYFFAAGLGGDARKLKYAIDYKGDVCPPERPYAYFPDYNPEWPCMASYNFKVCVESCEITSCNANLAGQAAYCEKSEVFSKMAQAVTDETGLPDWLNDTPDVLKGGDDNECHTVLPGSCLNAAADPSQYWRQCTFPEDAFADGKTHMTACSKQPGETVETPDVGDVETPDIDLDAIGDGIDDGIPCNTQTKCEDKGGMWADHVVTKCAGAETAVGDEDAKEDACLLINDDGNVGQGDTGACWWKMNRDSLTEEKCKSEDVDCHWLSDNTAACYESEGKYGVCMPSSFDLGKCDPADLQGTVTNAFKDHIADLKSALTLILAAAGIALFLSMLYTCLMKYLAGCIVWVSITLTFLCMCLVAWLLIDKGMNMDDPDPSAEGEVPSEYTSYKNWTIAAGCLVALCALIFMCIILCMCSSIKLAIAVSKVAGGAVMDMPCILLFPIWPAVLNVGLFIGWLYMMYLFVTSGTPTLKETPASILALGGGPQGIVHGTCSRAGIDSQVECMVPYCFPIAAGEGDDLVTWLADTSAEDQESAIADCRGLKKSDCNDDCDNCNDGGPGAGKTCAWRGGDNGLPVLPWNAGSCDCGSENDDDLFQCPMIQSLCVEKGFTWTARPDYEGPVWTTEQGANPVKFSQIGKYASWDFSEDEQMFTVALVFWYFWLNWFLTYFVYLAIAGAGADWYFTELDAKQNKWVFGDKDDVDSKGDQIHHLRLSSCPVCCSCWRATKYHMGTAALGAMIIAIIETLRAIVRYIKSTTAGKSNCFCNCVICCIDCCLGCMKCCCDKISKNALIFAAIYGDPFCTGAANSLSLITSQLGKFAAVSMVSSYICMFGRLCIALATTGLSAIALTYLEPWMQDPNYGECSTGCSTEVDGCEATEEGGSTGACTSELYTAGSCTIHDAAGNKDSCAETENGLWHQKFDEGDVTGTFLPLLFILIMSYFIAMFFLKPYETTIDTVFVCYMIEIAAGPKAKDGTPHKPLAPQPLRDLITKESQTNKAAYEKRYDEKERAAHGNGKTQQGGGTTNF